MNMRKQIRELRDLVLQLIAFELFQTGYDQERLIMTSKYQELSLPQWTSVQPRS